MTEREQQAYAQTLAKKLTSKPEADRAEQIFALAAKAARCNAPRQELEKVLIAAAVLCRPPFPEAWTLVIIEGAYGPRESIKEESVSCSPSTTIQDGWIKLHRKSRDHWLWPKREYSQFEAWVDLIMTANHKPAKVPIGCILIPIDRGQLLSSHVKLGKRWGWNRKTVARFLGLLKSENMLDIKTSKQRDMGGVLITICNYNRYQGEPKGGADIKTPTRTDIKDFNFAQKTDIKTTPQTDIKTDIRKTTETPDLLELCSGGDSAQTAPDGHQNFNTNGHQRDIKADTNKNANKSISEAFETAWSIYPKRSGGNSKPNAQAQWTSRVRGGVDPAEMIAGVERYSNYIRATGKTGTEFVKQAATFFGRGEHWKEPWDIPSDRANHANGGFVG